MWNSADFEKKKTTHRLPKEILRLFVVTLLITIVCFWTLNEVANRIVLTYVEEEMLVISEYQLIDLQYGILGISFLSAIVLFVVLFLFLLGERLAYISEIVKGIEAFRYHNWEYVIPLQGNNELTDLAQSVNRLSQEEKAFREKEKQMQEEKENLIRSLSHDIRTPLTSILAYSEYMRAKEKLEPSEVNEYMELMEQKAQQIKVLTDRLLDGGSRQLEFIENGRFLMEQLVDEWEAELENEFVCQIDMSNCPQFEGEVDIQELRRIFDNLASNIRKYADKSMPVLLQIYEKDNRICIFQSNIRRELNVPVESTKIGIESIRKIAVHYGGSVEVIQSGQEFSIAIMLMKINSNL